MNGGQRFFFNTNMKKYNNKSQRNHSHSNSSAKNYKSNKSLLRKHIPQPLSKKQQQIREAIQYRFMRSKMKGYVFGSRNMFSDRQSKSPKSSQMQEYQELKQIKIVSIKEFHEREPKKRRERSRNSLIRRLRLRTDHSMIMKNQNDQSLERIPFMNQYFNQTIKNSSRNPTDSGYKLTRIQPPITEPNKAPLTGNCRLKTDLNKISHRTLTPTNQANTRMKSFEKQWKLSPKSKDIPFRQKYNF